MKRLLTLFALTAALPSLALAATDGTLGSESTGSMTMTLNIDATTPSAQIQVSGLEDISFTTPTGIVPSSGAVGRTTFCVFMTGGTTYSAAITATPLLSAQFQNTVPYNFALVNTQGPYFIQPVSDQSVTRSQESLDIIGDEGDCTASVVFLAIVVGLDQTDPPIEAGIGTATLTLTVTPD